MDRICLDCTTETLAVINVSLLVVGWRSAVALLLLFISESS